MLLNKHIKIYYKIISSLLKTLFCSIFCQELFTYWKVKSQMAMPFWCLSHQHTVFLWLIHS